MDLATCECQMGRDGRLCKHQIAVAKFMGVSNRNIIPLNDPKQKQYLYYIATGKEMELEFFQSLRTQTKQHSTSQKSAMDNCDVSSYEGDQNRTDMNVEVNEIPTLEKSNTQMTMIEAEQNLKYIFDDLLNKSREKPDIYLPAIQAFSKKYNNMKTDANFISSLYCFGKTLNESTTSTNVFAVKRKGKKIRVQPTSVSRRRNMNLGKGSSSSANIGRPHKPKVLQEHKYASAHQHTKAPHSLATCVANDVSIGR